MTDHLCGPEQIHARGHALSRPCGECGDRFSMFALVEMADENQMTVDAVEAILVTRGCMFLPPWSRVTMVDDDGNSIGIPCSLSEHTYSV